MTGEHAGHLLCQEVQQLTVADESFETAVHTKMFQHCTDDHMPLRRTQGTLNARGLAAHAVTVFHGKKTVTQARLHRPVIVGIGP